MSVLDFNEKQTVSVNDDLQKGSKLKNYFKTKLQWLWSKTLNYTYFTLAVMILMVSPITVHYVMGTYKQGTEVTYLKCYAKVGDRTVDGWLKQRSRYQSILGYKLVNTHDMERDVFIDLKGQPLNVIGQTKDQYDTYRNRGGEFQSVKFRYHDSYTFQINDQIMVTTNFCR